MAFKSFSFEELKAESRPDSKPLTKADHSFAQMVRELSEASIPEPWPRHTLSPSKLPMCPWLAMLGHVAEALPDRTRSFMSDYYRGVGILVHEVVQDWLGRLGYLYGAYGCQGCSKNRLSQGMPKDPCDCGGTAWKYIEIDLKDADPTGELSGAYLDGLIRFDWMEPDHYYVVDFKTCSLVTTPRPEYGFKLDRHKKYLKQTGIYHHLLERQNIQIDGTAFMMIPRDNPKNSKVILFDQSDSNGQIFRDTIASWRAARQAAETGDCRDLKRDCETRFDNPECPFAKVCFDRQATEEMFRRRGLLAQLPENF